MKILLMHQTITTYDAIGTDIEYMIRYLNEEFPCFIYCEFFKKRETSSFPFLKPVEHVQLNRKEAEEFMSDPENLVIYHHSGFWEEGETLLEAARCHLMIRYHNVTPPEFFAGYSDFYFRQCLAGRQQTDSLSERHKDAFWLCDSQYNRTEIPNVPEERVGIIYPFHSLSQSFSICSSSDVEEDLKALQGTKILFTGRIVPNKGHLDLIEMAANFRENYGSSIHLIWVGKFDDSVKAYTKELKTKVRTYDLEEYVHFVGEVTDEDLRAYYQCCDYYVSFSNHEGFGVPLIEAQRWKLPLIVKDKGAAREIVGENQLVFGDDINLYSAAIAYLEKHPKEKEELKEAGFENYITRYEREDIGEKFREFVRKAGSNE